MDQSIKDSTTRDYSHPCASSKYCYKWGIPAHGATSSNRQDLPSEHLIRGREHSTCTMHIQHNREQQKDKRATDRSPPPPWIRHGWNYLQFTACTRRMRIEEDGHLALGNLARCEPLDENNSSSALWWLPILLIPPTRSKRLCGSGREPQQLVIAALRYANVQFTSEGRAQFLNMLHTSMKQSLPSIRFCTALMAATRAAVAALFAAMTALFTCSSTLGR